MSIKLLARTAMIAAIYTAISLFFAPLSFGPFQVRISEALVLLPVIAPGSIIGLTVGCILTNTVGFFMGANIIGWADIIFGSAATLIAALCTYAFRNIRFRGVPVLSAIPPVLCNAVIIGAELTFVFNGSFQLAFFASQAFSVGIGQIVSCMLFGLPLVLYIEKQPRLLTFFKE